MKRAAATIAFLPMVLMACAAAPAPPDDPAAAVEAATAVGKHFWETLSVPLGEPCRRPISPACSAAGQGFTVAGVVTGQNGEVFVRVRFDDGSEGYLPYAVGTAAIAWSNADPQAAERARLARLAAIRAAIAKMEEEYCSGGTLRLGMTRQEAVRAWCFPDHVRSTQTRKGTREEWIYPQRGTLYFDGDRLVEIRRLD